MNRHSPRSLLLLLALTGACGSNQTTPPADMTSMTRDLGTSDLATTPAGDMTVVPPKLTGVTCASATVTAAMVYSSVIMNNCAGSGCHQGNGATTLPLFGTSSTSFRAAVVSKQSSATMNYITPSDIDNSYLLYKIFNQQQKVSGGGGGQMPDNANPLSTANMCLLVNWVRSGAP